MRRVLIAFTIGLGLGLSVSCVRVVLRARKGLPTTRNPEEAGPGAQPAFRAPPVAELLERLKAALLGTSKPLRDAEAEPRSAASGGK
ncbi:MAG TPA: hypothetical protein VHA57_00105 [Actinomycetota bacterium]|nr:hypothetical protein [Actinomycetota bacterium]